MSLKLSTLVKQSSDQVSCNIDREVAILNLKSTLYFGLDDVGSFIWQMMREPTRVVEICKAIVDQFEVDEAQSQVDVMAFLGELDKVGLIELVSSTTTAPQRKARAD